MASVASRGSSPSGFGSTLSQAVFQSTRQARWQSSWDSPSQRTPSSNTAFGRRRKLWPSRQTLSAPQNAELLPAVRRHFLHEGQPLAFVLGVQGSQDFGETPHFDPLPTTPARQPVARCAAGHQDRPPYQRANRIRRAVGPQPLRCYRTGQNRRAKRANWRITGIARQGRNQCGPDFQSGQDGLKNRPTNAHRMTTNRAITAVGRGPLDTADSPPGIVPLVVSATGERHRPSIIAAPADHETRRLRPTHPHRRPRQEPRPGAAPRTGAKAYTP